MSISVKNIFDLDSPFANFMNTLAGILWVGILWLVCSIPLITIGAASSAAYNVTVNVVRRGRNYVTSSFFEAFKDNFVVSLPVQFIALIVALLLGFDCVYLYGYGTEFSQMLSYILYAFIIVFFAIMFYIYPIMQRFDESRIEIFKLAFYMTFRHLLSTIGLLILFALALAAVYMLPWSLIAVPGIWWFCQSLIIERILRKFSTIDAEDDDGEEGSEEDNEDYAEETSSGKAHDNAYEEDTSYGTAHDNAYEKDTSYGKAHDDAYENEDGNNSLNTADGTQTSKKVVVKRRRLKKLFKPSNKKLSSNGTLVDNPAEDGALHDDLYDDEGFKDRIIKKK